MTKRKSIGKELTEAAVEIIAGSETGRVGRTELLDALRKKLPHLCKDSEKDKRERPKWEIQLDAYSSPSLTGGLFEKNNREWSLTQKGLELASQKKPLLVAEGDADDTSDDITNRQWGNDIADYINEQDPHNTGKWFETLVAALLRGMGYQYVRVSGKTGDGGVDVVAYKDKLGATLPRIKVQAKHLKKKQEVREADILKLAAAVHEGEIGLFVTSSTFATGAKKRARDCGKHVELVDIDRLTELWGAHYPNMSAEDQKIMPLNYGTWYVLDKNRIKQEKAAD